MALFGLLLLGFIGLIVFSALFAVLGVALHAVVWLLLLPFRLIGAVVMLPFLLLRGVIAGVAALFAFGVVAVVFAVLAVAFGLAILAPLLPLLLVVGLIWVVMRAIRRPAIAS